MLTRWPTRRRRRLVLARVWGMISTANQESLTSATVRLTPSRATEPRSTRNLRHSRSRKEKVKRELWPPLLMARTRTVPSMWPLTRWPPRKPFGSQRELDVQERARGQVAQVGEAQGRRCQVEAQQVAVFFYQGQADAVDGQRVAHGERLVQGGADGQDGLVLFFQLDQGGGGCDQAGEHVGKPRKICPDVNSICSQSIRRSACARLALPDS